MKFTGFSAALLMGSAVATPLVYGVPPKYGDSTPSAPTATPAPTTPPYGSPAVPSTLPIPSGTPLMYSCPIDDYIDDIPADLPEVEGLEVNVFVQILPGVLSIINGLGFGGLAPSILALLKIDIVASNIVSLNVEALLQGRQVPEISGLSTGQVTKIVAGLLHITTVLKLDQITAGGAPPIDGISSERIHIILDVVVGLVGKLGLQSMFTFLVEIPATTNGHDFLVVEGLLAQLAPLVSNLLNALGLGVLAPLLSSLLKALSIAV